MSYDLGAKAQFKTIDVVHNKKRSAKLKNDYENYQDQLDSYGRKSYLDEWSPLNSSRLPPLKSSVVVNPQKKQKRYEEKQVSLVQKQQNHNNETIKKQQRNNQLVSKYTSQTQIVNYKLIPQKQLEKQLKQMRGALQHLNSTLNTMIDRYQLSAAGEFKSASLQANQPQKQAEILQKQIQKYKKLGQQQDQEIKKIEQQEKQYEQRDYLVDLQMKVQQICKQIYTKKKQRKHKQVQVDKKNNVLIDMKEQKQKGDQQFKAIKTVRFQIMHHLKKFHENKDRIEQLDKNIYENKNKNDEYQAKLDKYKKIVQNKYLCVAINKPLIEMKKMHMQLINTIQNQKKKIQIRLKSQKVNEDKITKDIDQMNTQSISIDRKLQGLQIMINHLSQQTDTIIKQNNIQQKLLKGISYKFTANFIKHSSFSRTPELPKQNKKNSQIKSNQSEGIFGFLGQSEKNKLEKTTTEDKLLKKKKQTEQLIINDKNKLEFAKQHQGANNFSKRYLISKKDNNHQRYSSILKDSERQKLSKMKRKYNNKEDKTII